MENKLKASVTFKVEFYDVDSMKVAWHGNYMRFFELARCALLDKIGYGYCEMEESGFMWPVVDMHIKYIRPLTFKQIIIAEATLEEYEVCLKMSFKLIDSISKAVLTKAECTQMAVNANTHEAQFFSPKCFLDLVHKALLANAK